MRLLITGAWRASTTDLDTVRRLGHDIIILPHEEDALPCRASEIEGCVCNGLFLHHPIEHFSALRYIQLTSAGYDRVPMDYVRERRITIRNARGVYSIPMAEFVLGGVLQIYKQAIFFRKNQACHHWEKHRGLRELYRKTVGVVGCGSVGTACAKLFSSLGCRVVGVDIAVQRIPEFDQIYPITDLDYVLGCSQVIILTLPLTPATCHLFSSERFGVMKSDAVIVNVSRGAVVDTDALIAWLRNNPSAGAVLDVFENEPLNADSQLWSCGNAIITPHNCFISDGIGERLFQCILEGLEVESGIDGRRK